MNKRNIILYLSITISFGCGSFENMIDIAGTQDVSIIKYGFLNNSDIVATYAGEKHAAGKDEDFLTEDDRIRYYTLTSKSFPNITSEYSNTIEVSGNIVFDNTGPDKKWFTNDDTVQTRYEFPYYDAQTEQTLNVSATINEMQYQITHRIDNDTFSNYFFGSNNLKLGVDSIVHITLASQTVTDITTMYYQHYTSPGDDDTWFTDDDELVIGDDQRNISHWKTESSPFYYQLTEYASAGDDEIRFNEDDEADYQLTATLVDEEGGNFQIVRIYNYFDYQFRSVIKFDSQGWIIESLTTHIFDDLEIIRHFSTSTRKSVNSNKVEVTERYFGYPMNTVLGTVDLGDSDFLDSYSISTYLTTETELEKSRVYAPTPGKDGLWFTEDDERYLSGDKIVILGGDKNEKTIEEKKRDLFDFFIHSADVYARPRSLIEYWY